jgi:hypothetical protein
VLELDEVELGPEGAADDVAAAPFPTEALALNALVVFDCRAHAIPPVTCPMNRLSCHVSLRCPKDV